MTLSVKEIERAIESLPEPDLAELTAWFAHRDAEAWDAQIEADANAGKFDAIIAAVRARDKAGLSRPLSADFPVPDLAEERR